MGDPKTTSTARILEDGEPCEAVIVQSQAMGMRSASGKDMYALLLTVMAEGMPSYQTQVGNPVPLSALPLLYPGNTVPARRMPDGAEHEIVIDWDVALAAAADTSACEAKPRDLQPAARPSPVTTNHSTRG